MTAQPTTEQLHKAIGVVCKVIGQIPCYHVYEDFVAGRFGKDTAEISLMAMTHNAALDSALLSLRCFNEFFKPDGRKDDVRSYHFPGLVMKPFLDPPDELAIHKFLAHLTLTRVDMAAKPWLLDRMTLQGLQHGIQFLSYVKAKLPLASPPAAAEVQSVCDGCRIFMTRIEKRHRSPDNPTA